MRRTLNLSVPKKQRVSLKQEIVEGTVIARLVFHNSVELRDAQEKHPDGRVGDDTADAGRAGQQGKLADPEGGLPNIDQDLVASAYLAYRAYFSFEYRIHALAAPQETIN